MVDDDDDGTALRGLKPYFNECCSDTQARFRSSEEQKAAFHRQRYINDTSVSENRPLSVYTRNHWWTITVQMVCGLEYFHRIQTFHPSSVQIPTFTVYKYNNFKHFPISTIVRKTVDINEIFYY